MQPQTQHPFVDCAALLATNKCGNNEHTSTMVMGPVLTHLHLGKMANNLADDFFKRIFWNENVWILIKISLTICS